MKTIVCVVGLLIPASFSFANGEEEKNKTGNDSTEVKNVKEAFEVTQSACELDVIAVGSFGAYASVSVTTTRGSDILFEFIKNGKNSLHFDISKLDVGSYYVVLTSKDEIRMKPFQVK